MLKTKHKIMIIAVLSIVAVSLGCIAFSSGNGAAHSVMPTATPETVTVYIPMPEPTPTAVPIPLPTEAPATPIAVETKQPEERTDSRTEEPSPTITVSDGAFTLEANSPFSSILLFPSLKHSFPAIVIIRCSCKTKLGIVAASTRYRK